MMAPSAAPTILLYAFVDRHALAGGEGQDKLHARPAPRRRLSAGLAGLSRSPPAALDSGLERAGLVSAMLMGSQSGWLSSAVLSPPASASSRRSSARACRIAALRRPFLAAPLASARFGALRLGALHGGNCVGCCWMLMAFFFQAG